MAENTIKATASDFLKKVKPEKPPKEVKSVSDSKSVLRPLPPPSRNTSREKELSIPYGPYAVDFWYSVSAS